MPQNMGGAISSWRISSSMAWAHGVQTDQAWPRFRAFLAMTLRQRRHRRRRPAVRSSSSSASLIVRGSAAALANGSGAHAARVGVQRSVDDLGDQVRGSVEHVLVGGPAGRIVLVRGGLSHRGPPLVRVPSGAGCATAARERFCRLTPQVWAPARSYAMSVRHTRHRSRSDGAISRWRVSSSIAWAHGVQTDQA